ncbi:MAG: lipid kinase [Alphaproteobacteria bacterium]|nr:lipid kinase [Alphaproteobacteria bacterium]MBF0392293.1 lipid kinase [Alphaproteobacteria bacterium]
MKRAVLIINRHSRRGGEDTSRLAARLRALGLDLIVEEPGDKHEVAGILARHRASVDLVVLGGGDGTLSAAAPALMAAGRPFAVLPLGTANDLARTLGVPLSPEEACAVAANGQPHPIDLGEVNGHYFFNVASLGLTAEVKRHLSHDVKRRWGVAGYALSAMRAVREARGFRAEIHVDGRPAKLRAVQIAVGNGRHYGGGMTIAWDARIDDHHLDLTAIAPRGPAGLVLLIPGLRRGRLEGRSGVLVERGREIHIATDRSMPVSADGDVVTRTPAHFRVIPRALTVMVPRSEASDAAQ